MVFEGVVVPDPLVAAGLVGATLCVAAALFVVRPPVSERLVLAFVPWMVLGSTLHVLSQMQATLTEAVLPPPLPVLFSAPSVYLTTFVLMGAVLSVAARSRPDETRSEPVAPTLAGLGTAAALVAVGYATWLGLDRFALTLLVPVAGLLAALALAAALYAGLRRLRAAVVRDAGYVGGLVVFAHAFDAITTAVGTEVFDTAERSTVPRLLLDLGADLPAAPLLGEAWLFVAVKLVVALAVVVAFHDYVVERPTEGYLFLGLVAAVGFGPGTYNFLLFALGVAA